MKKSTKKTQSQALRKRVREATENLERMQTEFGRYMRSPKVERVSTAGKWCEASTMTADRCYLQKRPKQDARN